MTHPVFIFNWTICKCAETNLHKFIVAFNILVIFIHNSINKFILMYFFVCLGVKQHYETASLRNSHWLWIILLPKVYLIWWLKCLPLLIPDWMVHTSRIQTLSVWWHDGFLSISTLAFLLFLDPAEGSNPAGPIF